MKKKTAKESKSKSWIMDYVPIDITTNILTKLPIKSIIRCRSVCKSWRYLIDDPNFSFMHLRNNSHDQSSSSSSSSLVLCTEPFKGFLYMIDVHHKEASEVVVKSSKIEIPIYDNKSGLFLRGSSNGLVCLSTRRDFWKPHQFDCLIYISNPATGEYIRLPDFTPPCTVCSGMYVSLGFWFDPNGKKFKVVRILRCPSRSPRKIISCKVARKRWLPPPPPPPPPLPNCETNKKSEVQVYTQGANSWRKVSHDLDVCIEGKGSGVLVNRSVHWLRTFPSVDIVSFDMECESFGIIPVPEFGFHFRLLQLGVLGGFLFVSNSCPPGKDWFEIWVLKDYNVYESWTKQFVIRKNINNGLDICTMVPVSLGMNGKLVLLCDFGFIISYNHENGSTTLLESDQLPKYGVSSTMITQAFPHFGSLVSPKFASPQERTTQGKMHKRSKRHAGCGRKSKNLKVGDY